MKTIAALRFSLLADRPDAIPTVADWYFNDIGHKIEGNSFEETCKRIRGKLNRDKPPLHVLAIKEEKVVGVAQWKLREMPEYPEREHWLGSVFVPPEERGQGIALQLALKIAEMADFHGVEQIFLCTEKLDGGLYKKAGWVEFERTISRGDHVLIMVKTLKAIALDVTAK